MPEQEPVGSEQGEQPTTWWSTRRLLALGAVLVVAIAAPLIAVRAGKTDSAALFVGVPLTLAAVIVLAPPAKSLHGMTLRVVSFGLLITSALLHEGAACVLIAASRLYLARTCPICADTRTGPATARATCGTRTSTADTGDLGIHCRRANPGRPVTQ